MRFVRILTVLLMPYDLKRPANEASKRIIEIHVSIREQKFYAGT